MDYSKYHEPFQNISENKIGILVLHGFTSTTSSMQYLAESFAKAGYNVELPALTGHGTCWQDMKYVKYTDWIKDAERALEKLQKRCSKIFFCGLSMGGAIALHLAGEHSDFDGIILINHAVKFHHPKFWFIPIIKKLIPSVTAIASDIKKPGVTEIAYERTPTSGVHELLKMLKRVRKYLPEINKPTLIFKSIEDHVISRSTVKYTLNKLASKHKDVIWLQNSYHVATLDNDKDKIVRKSREFIEDFE